MFVTFLVPVQFYKGTCSYNFLVKYMVKKIGSQNMAVISCQPNLCYNKVCYKGYKTDLHVACWDCFWKR